jgi:hypothetical protein
MPNLLNTTPVLVITKYADYVSSTYDRNYDNTSFWCKSLSSCCGSHVPNLMITFINVRSCGYQSHVVGRSSSDLFPWWQSHSNLAANKEEAVLR